VTHPAWCDRSRCTVEPDLPLDDAVHLSRVVTVDGAITTAGPEDIDVWLHQGAAGDDVHLVLDGLGGARVMFPLTTAAAAAGAVTQLIEQAITGGRSERVMTTTCEEAGPATTDTSVALGIMLAEYGAIKDEQIKRVDRRDHLVYGTLGAIAATLAAASKLPEALLLLPLATVVLGWTHLATDQKISAAGRYLRHDLGARLSALAGEPVLSWETAHRSDPHRRQRKRIQLAIDAATFAAPALVSLGAYLLLTDPPLLGWIFAPLLAAAAVVLVAQQTRYARTAHEDRAR
jgi:hypothetical protein